MSTYPRLSPFECAEGLDKVHAFLPHDKRTLCGRSLTSVSPVGMEWWTEEELPGAGDRPCQVCLKATRKAARR